MRRSQPCAGSTASAGSMCSVRRVRVTSTESSDVDLLVEFEEMPPPTEPTRTLGLLTAVETLLERHIDLVETGAVRNPYLVRVSRSPANSSMPRDPRAWLTDVVAACELRVDFTRGKTFSYAGRRAVAVGCRASVRDRRRSTPDYAATPA